MTTFEQYLSDWIRQMFQTAFPSVDLSSINVCVVPTTDESHGEYQCNAAMAIGRMVKKSPREVAQAVLGRSAAPDGVERMEVAGPGFVNFFLSSAALASRLEVIQGDERFGVPAIGSGRTVVIDYSSPNVAKPMHIGHIRSTVIGNALDRLHRFLGFRVISDNHLGDWGTQFGILIMGYRNYLNPQALADDPIAELERLYVKSYERAEQDEAWKNAARAELVKLQRGDAENRELWKRFVDLSVEEFARIYERLGVSFDLTRGESHYHDKLQGVIDQLTLVGGSRRRARARLSCFWTRKYFPSASCRRVMARSIMRPPIWPRFKAACRSSIPRLSCT